MFDTFKRLADQIAVQTRYIDPYLQSHPMPAERVAALEEIAQASPYWDKKDPPELQLRHDMMRAKLSGFLERPDTVARRYPPSDNSLPARYARAISTYRYGDPRGALAQIDALIQAQPQQSVFLRAQGPGAAGRRPAGRGDRAAAPGRPACAQRAADRRSCSARR